ncbi:MAG TPA: Cof-type HAD-IIB family hydrolase [Stellaceae bacterium]|nr:Cof-type HAD-IIB family hydrolase [Stellaceae bacterium]
MDRIALVISDVDGTLVTSQKRVTDRTRQAVAALHKRGIGFTVVSSRPAFGLRMLIETLAIDVPVAACNGSVIASPQLELVEQRGLDRGAVSEILEFLEARRLGVWLFTSEEWVTRDLGGAHVSHETITVQKRPTIVESFDPFIDRAIKIVGVSDDFDRLAEIEKRAQMVFARRATAARSQNYYLDFVAPGVNKGVAVEKLSRATAVPTTQIATLGDGENDVPMFHRSGLSIAMGNASEVVKREAREATLPNDQDGFAAAIERFILPRAA